MGLQNLWSFLLWWLLLNIAESTHWLRIAPSLISLLARPSHVQNGFVWNKRRRLCEVRYAYALCVCARACVCACVRACMYVCVCVCVCVCDRRKEEECIYMYVCYFQEEITVDSVIESLRAIEHELKEKNRKYNDLNSKLAKTTEVGLSCQWLHVQHGTYIRLFIHAHSCTPSHVHPSLMHTITPTPLPHAHYHTHTPPSCTLPHLYPSQAIQAMRLEIAAQNEIIAIMDEGLKEHEKHHDACPLDKKPV